MDDGSGGGEELNPNEVDELVDALKTKWDAVNAKYQTIQWPVSCHGRLKDAEAANCHINRQRLSDQLIQLAKQQAKTRVEDKLKDKLGGDLKQLLNNRLEGLFR